MSSTPQSHASPVASGAVTALGSLLTAIAVVLVPALAAQLAAARSTATVLDAILISVNVIILGHGGGTILSTGVIEGAMTLTPLGLTVILLLVTGAGMRRTGRRLDLISADGGLRTRGLRDAGAALAAFVLAYAVGLGLLAQLGRGELMDPVASSAVVSGALVAMLGGLGGLAASVRRKAADGVPAVRILDLFPRPWDAVVRSTLMAMLGLLAIGMVALVLMLLIGFRQVSALHEQLDPGVVGGVVLTLLQLSLLPLFAVWAAIILLGGTVTFGVGTSLGLGGFASGVMPLLPLLGALPQPGSAPWPTHLLVLLPATAIGIGAVSLVREVSDLELRDRVTAWVAYPAAVIIAVLLLTGLSGGALGDGRLSHVGPAARSLLIPLPLLAIGVTGAVVGLLGTTLVPWARSGIEGLRQRVETAEARETENPAAAEDSADQDSADQGAAEQRTAEQGPAEQGTAEQRTAKQGPAEQGTIEP